MSRHMIPPSARSSHSKDSLPTGLWERIVAFWLPMPIYSPVIFMAILGYYMYPVFASELARHLPSNIELGPIETAKGLLRALSGHRSPYTLITANGQRLDLGCVP